MSSPFPKVIPLPSKSISMHAASCDRVVLVLTEAEVETSFCGGEHRPAYPSLERNKKDRNKVGHHGQHCQSCHHLHGQHGSQLVKLGQHCPHDKHGQDGRDVSLVVKIINLTVNIVMY